MARSRRGSIGPYLLVALLNVVVFLGGMVPLAVHGFDKERPFEVMDAGWPGLALLALALVGLAALVLGGIVLRIWPKIPSLVLALFPALVALFGVFGAHQGAQMALWATSGESVEPTQRGRIIATGVHEALNSTVIGGYIASLLLIAAAITIALRHWPSRGALSSGARAGLIGGVLMLAILIAVGFFWPPLGTFGSLPWIATLLGLIAIAFAAHAVRNDPGDEANRNAAGEVWITLLFSAAALVVVVFTRYANALMVGTASFDGDPSKGTADLSTLVSSWTAAEPALYASALFLVPLVFATIASMLSRESLGSWGLRRAAVNLVVIPILVAGAAFALFLHTGWLASKVAEAQQCESKAVANAELEIPQIAAGNAQSECVSAPLIVNHAGAVYDGKQLVKATDLDNDAGCKRLAEAIDSNMVPTLDVLIDGREPYSRMECVTKALAASQLARGKTSLYLQLNPDKRSGHEGVMVLWVGRGEAASTPPGRAPFHKPITALFVQASFAGVPGSWQQGLAHVHVTPKGWRLQRTEGAQVEKWEGPQQQLASTLRDKVGNDTRVGITAEPEVPARVVLAVLAQFPMPQLWTSAPGAKPDAPAMAEGTEPPNAGAGATDGGAASAEAGDTAAATRDAGQP